MRVGWISDTHIGATRKSCWLVRQAMDLFRSQAVDLVINNGDIADRWTPSGYEFYRAEADEAFATAAKKPREIFCWAWHDSREWTGSRTDATPAERRKDCFADVAKRLRIAHGMTDLLNVNGLAFVVVPQYVPDVEWNGRKGAEAYELLLQDAERAGGGRPVFVVDHIPPRATVADSVVWGSEWRRNFLSKHPGVIHLSGHTHGSLRDENQIWQGAFTAVNAACLEVWQGESLGCAEPSKRSFGAVVIEVFPTKVVFRRFDVRDGTEHCARDPWTVPWPFDPERAPYAPAHRVKTTPVPLFGPGARPVVRADEPFAKFTVTLPQVAVGGDFAYRYRMTVSERTADGWRTFKTLEKYTQFYLRPDARADNVEIELSSGYFTAGRRYRFDVAPVNFFGVAGKAVSCEVVAPAAEPVRTIWSCASPMSDLKFVYGDNGTDDGPAVPLRDGWYEDSGEKARLVIPACAWNVPIGARIRLTVDMEIVQGADRNARSFCLRLKREKPSLVVASGRVYTPRGAAGLQRYVFELTKETDVSLHLIVEESDSGRIRFHSLETAHVR